MQRRKFLKKASLATAATIAVPYILPSGRLFAQTGNQLAEHVIYVLFAGGVRQQESVLQEYLTAQGLPFEGNIMLNILDGDQPGPNEKRVYGTDPPIGSGPRGSIPLPQVIPNTLQSQGVLIKEVEFSQGGTGHYNGLTTVSSGNYGFNGLRNRPPYPTIFEYVRRHLGVPATKAWFIGNGIGNSTQLLNYSDHPNYGPQYGANFVAPGIVFGGLGNTHLRDARTYQDNEIDRIYEMKHFLDQSFQAERGLIPGITNTDEERKEIKDFLEDLFTSGIRQDAVIDIGESNGELLQTSYACEVMRRFKPTLTVINYNSIDTCHSSFTNYLRNMHRCDHAVGKIWQFIQHNPSFTDMKDKTALVLVPEHGRSKDPNPILDENDWRAFDHNGDPNSRRMFSLMVGAGVPQGITVDGTMNGNTIIPAGDATDCVPTVAELLGIKNDVISAGLLSGSAQSMFDRII